MRTQDEIVARIREVQEDDWLGFRQEVLLAALDFEHARPFVRPDVTAAQWEEMAVPADRAEQVARDYYRFALSKIRGHRGISASRSVEKLTEYAWLLGRDDALAAVEAADYALYGAPKVKAWGEAFGEEWPDEPWAVRMGAGLPCTDECFEGCSE